MSGKRMELILYLVFFLSLFLPWCKQMPEVSGGPLNGFVFVMFLIMSGVGTLMNGQFEGFFNVLVAIALVGAVLLAIGVLLSGGQDEVWQKNRKRIFYMIAGALPLLVVLVMMHLIGAGNSMSSSFLLLLVNLGYGAYAALIVPVGLWLLSQKRV